MSKRKQARYSAEQKAKILKLHLVEGVKLSEVCEQYSISPATFYNWQKKLFENAPSVLSSAKPGRNPEKAKDEKIKALEAKIAYKDDVLREAVEALVMSKKHTGENSTDNG